MTIEELSARLESVEGDNRRMRRWGGALVVVLAAVAVMGQAFPGQTVTAKQLEIRDDSGNLRAALGIGENGAGNLWLYDSSDILRSQVGLSPVGESGLWLHDSDGMVRIQLVRTPATEFTGSQSELKLDDANGTCFLDGATLGASLSLRSSGGDEVFAFADPVHGLPALQMTDWRGKVRFLKRFKAPLPR